MPPLARPSPRAAALVVLLLLLCFAPCAASALDAARYATLLTQHTRAVDDIAGTRVDYAALRASQEWRALVDGLDAAAPPPAHERSAQLAFWINAYNILAMDMVVRHAPQKSIRDIGSWYAPVWKRDAGRVGGRAVTLDEIEHRVLRPLGEPRIHAAIVCASLSCPSLRREPYRATTLDAQLDADLRRFLQNPRKGLRIERASGRVLLSSIFDWFEEDFKNIGGVRALLLQYAPEDAREFLRRAPPTLEFKNLPYDWRLNTL